MRIFALFLILMTASSTIAWADVDDTRAVALGRQIRCMVCEGQSIEDSNASLAADMRHYVRARMEKGDSDAAIIDQLRSRYGDAVTLKPPVNGATYPLWILPPLLLVGGFVIFVLQSRKPSRRRRS